MSYHVHVEMRAGAPGVFTDDRGVNYTSNMAGAWCAAGADVAEFDGTRAGDCAPILADAIAVIERDPVAFTEYEPANGWGSVDMMLDKFLKPMLVLFRDYPDATVKVLR